MFKRDHGPKTVVDKLKLKLPRITKDIVSNNSSGGYKGVRPPPVLTYNKADLEDEEIQRRIDKAFDILFEATELSISAQTGDKKL